MHKSVKLAAAIALAFGSITVPALATEQPQAQQQQITRTTLKNGLQVVIVQDKLAPVVTTQVNYLVGSNEVPDGFPGTAHAVEHMMFRGSPGLNKEQISALAANMGGHF